MKYKCLGRHAFNGHEEDETRSIANGGMRGPEGHCPRRFHRASASRHLRKKCDERKYLTNGMSVVSSFLAFRST